MFDIKYACERSKICSVTAGGILSNDFSIAGVIKKGVTRKIGSYSKINRNRGLLIFLLFLHGQLL